MVTKAKLTAGNPEGDVMWGVDNTLLSAALDGKVFEPYRADRARRDRHRSSPRSCPATRSTPVDFGDVCVNYDAGWFADTDIAAADVASTT